MKFGRGVGRPPLLAAPWRLPGWRRCWSGWAGALLLLCLALGAGCVSPATLTRTLPGEGFQVQVLGQAQVPTTFPAQTGQLLRELATHHGLALPTTRLTLSVYPSAGSLRAAMRQQVPQYHSRPALCYETTPGDYTIAITDALAQASPTARGLLAHELTHYLLASHYPILPPWLDEALAQLAEYPASPPPALPPPLPWSADQWDQLLALPMGQPMSNTQYEQAVALLGQSLTRAGWPATRQRVLTYLRACQYQPPSATLARAYFPPAP